MLQGFVKRRENRGNSKKVPYVSPIATILMASPYYKAELYFSEGGGGYVHVCMYVGTMCVYRYEHEKILACFQEVFMV